MQKLKNLQSLLRKKKISAFLVSKPENLFYLTGFRGTNGTLLVAPKKYELITDARYFYTVKKLKIPYFDQSKGLKKSLGRYAQIAFEQNDVTVGKLKYWKKQVPGVKWKGVSGLVEQLRLIKNPDEIKIIRQATKMAIRALELFEKTIRVGQSEDEMEWNLLQVVREVGADGFSFPPIITFGKETADIHHQKGDNRLKKGQQMLLDFGLIYRGYITDMTRMFYTKEPSKKLQQIHNLVHKANQAAIDSIEIGKSLKQVDAAARQVIADAGYGDYFTHSTGHGTGVEVHEAPTVSTKSRDKVGPNMVFTIEPGIYAEGLGGVRIEDMVWVKPSGGVEVLTEWERELRIL